MFNLIRSLPGTLRYRNALILGGRLYDAARAVRIDEAERRACFLFEATRPGESPER